MARINTAQLAAHATNVGALGYRMHQVQQDPAVQKAWSEAGSDVARSAKSISVAVYETRAAWHRTAPQTTMTAPA